MQHSTHLKFDIYSSEVEKVKVRPLTPSRSTLSVVKVQTHLVLTEVCLCPGESGLCELCESLLRGHRGGDEGNLHIQPHLEAV